jgi:hypothetical protein
MSKVTFEEKEYRIYEDIAKKTGFETVDELVNYALKQLIKKYLIETEEVQVWVPKKLLRLVQTLKIKDWEEYLSDSVTDSLAADVHAEVFGKFDQVIKDFGLAEEFQFYQGH